MTAYAIVNLKGTDDSAASFGLPETLEARFVRVGIAAEQSGPSYERLTPNARLPVGQSHRDREEMYARRLGPGVIKLNAELHNVSQWLAFASHPLSPRLRRRPE